MFHVTESAKKELQTRLQLTDSNQVIRLQMRNSCFMKLKLTLEESTQLNDMEIIIDEMHFIIEKGQCHYFSNKKLDFIPDQTGFNQFKVM